MTENVFEISGLECAYNQHHKPVLAISSLSIPKGGISTILGKSGSGKSTFIETLGMMNNTIRKGSIKLSTGDDYQTIDQQIWEKPATLSEIRNRYFSFIFQNDYLMPYYTPLQNILIGNLIQQQGKSLSGSSEKAKVDDLMETCHKLGLDLSKNQMPYDMSGGQRQRLSFIRAISKDYLVIFGDEPTGNLDDDTSEKLMQVLKNSVAENPRRSALLVSHNIKLSISWSDRLIILSPGAGPAYEVDSANVFDRMGTQWKNQHGRTLTDVQMSDFIREMLRPNANQN